MPFKELKEQFATCRALIFPGEEDFGIIPVEVMASGRPVIAYGRGGALDTVIEGTSGVHFSEQSVESLNGAIDRFEADPTLAGTPQDIRAFAQEFDTSVFKQKMAALIENATRAQA